MEYFIADTHFNHRLVSSLRFPEYTGDDLLEYHNREVLKSITDTVKPKDDLFILGDICFSKDFDYFLSQIPCSKHLIKGNHDYRNKKIFQSKHWKTINDVLMFRKNKMKVFLSHYAHLVWPDMHNGSYMICGHSHGSIPFDKSIRRVDVGFEVFRKPISLDEVVELFI